MSILTNIYLLSYHLSLATMWQPLLLVFIVIVLVCVLIQNHRVRRRVHQSVVSAATTYEMMEKALKIADNDVVIYDIQKGTIRRLRGSLFTTAEMPASEFSKHLHPDDVAQALATVHQLIDGKKQSVEYSYRWNISPDGEEPEWLYIRNNSVTEYVAGNSKPVSIISVLVDETDIRRQQLEEEGLTKRYMQIFEGSIVGLSFYSPEGWLLASNKMMREICHFDSDEGDAFFSKMNLFDMAPFNEVLDRYHPNEYLACSLSIVPEREMYVYLEIGVHPIYDEEGKLIYLSVAARDISEERDLYIQAKKNDLEIQKINESIQLYEKELRYMMETCGLQAWRISLERNVIEFYSGLSSVDRQFTLQELKSMFSHQEDEIVRSLDNPAEAIAKPLSYIGPMNADVISGHREPQWVQINSIPEYDEEGQLKGAFGIWRNIHQLMHKQELLKQETERANDSGRMKSAFLANMTHEIRTPLNAIVGFSDLLQAMEQPEEKRELIRIIHNNCDMLLRLINDILVLSSVDSTGLELIPEHVDFSKEFDVICQSLEQRVDNPNVEFQKENPLPSLMVTIDNGRIQQVITNFVTNAVKNTQQGHIRVGYRVEQNGDGKSLYVYCEDTGSGIPEEEQTRIFERFVKLNDFVQGTGLGLSICKAIIEKCGGEINVESEADKGSTFWFRIPIEVISEE